MKKLFLSILAVLIFNNLMSMIEIDADYLKMPHGYECYRLFYSRISGFHIEIEEFLFPLGNEYVDPDLVGLDPSALLVKLGKLWEAEYMGRRFLVSRLRNNSYLQAEALGLKSLPLQLDQAVKAAMPPKRLLHVYFVKDDRMGVGLINECEKDKKNEERVEDKAS